MFDIIVGNPPFNAQNTKTKSAQGGKPGATIWNKFVVLILDKLLTENGFLCFVHPPRWRRVDSVLWNPMTQYQFHYLNIFDEKDGYKIFGVGTKFDWYVLEKIKQSKPTEVIDMFGEKHSIDFREWKFLPSHSFDLIASTLDDEYKENYLFFRSNYDTRHKYLSKTKSDEFKYPIVNAVRKNENILYWSSRNDMNPVGIPKVIISMCGGIRNALIDFDGEYGCTYNCCTIPISTLEQGIKIKKALLNSRFQKIINATKTSAVQVSHYFFRYLKSDWWEDFQDE